jgi:Na+-translocating ferredoxin:NAD+ oxidoreductase subunit C
MKQLLTFPRGGTRVPPRSQESRRAPIATAAMPPVAVVPMSRRGGTAADCLVRPGDRVTEGQLIGRPAGERSVPVHAPIPGAIVDVRETTVGDGTISLSAVIELGGAFARSGRPPSEREWKRLDPARIITLIAEAGVALDGRPEPLAVRFAAARRRSAQVLVANAIESEPWLAAQFRLFAERPAEIAEGLRIAQAVLECPRVVLAVSEEAAYAADAVAAAGRSAGVRLEVVIFDERYPQEDETLLAAALLRRQPPRGGTALDLGAMVISVASLAALRDAVVLARPCLERVVTVAGSALRTPGNLTVRIGTRAGELVEEVGGLATRPAAVVFGGAMTGRTFPGEAAWQEIPVTRDVPAILLLARGDLGLGRQRQCLRCARCVDACPWGLVPVRLYELAGSGAFARASAEGLGECTGCGCCSYACPSRIPLAAALAEARDRSAGGGA